MKSVALLFSIVLALTTVACTGGGDRLQPQLPEEGRLIYEPNTTYDGQVLSIELTHRDESTTTLTTARNAVDRGEPFRPAMPGHSGWTWALVNTAQNSTTYAYAGVSWANDDPTDYLAAGYWLHYPSHPPDPSTIEVSGFIDGPELDVISNPPRMPVQGQATYGGRAGGLHYYKYGDGWGAELAGTLGIDEYEAIVTLTADFSDNTLRGCIGCEGDITLRQSQLHQHLSDAWQPLAAPLTDYELHLGAAPFNPDNGTFEHLDVTVMHPERTITQLEGFWGGVFSNVPDPDGNPRLVSGFSSALFGEADGSLGYFWGVFNGLSASWLAEAEESQEP